MDVESITTAANSVIIGKDCGTNTTSTDMVMIGTECGRQCTGSSCVMIGNKCSSSVTSAQNTVVIGTSSGELRSSDSVIIGFDAGNPHESLVGNYNTTNNVIIGTHASSQTLAASPANVFIGWAAGMKGGGQGHNVGIGVETMINLGYSDGFNTCVGGSAGEGLGMYGGTSVNNTCLGYMAGYSGNIARMCTAIGSYTKFYDNLTGSTAIGYGATATQDWTFQLGNSLTRTVIFGDGTANCQTVSDIRMKDAIVDSTLGLQFLLDLQPRQYVYKNSTVKIRTSSDQEEITETVTHKRPHFGFIAQEVKAVMDKHSTDFAGFIDPTVIGTKDPDPRLSLVYTEFIGPIVKAIQELNVKVDSMSKAVQALDTEVASIRSRLTALEQR